MSRGRIAGYAPAGAWCSVCLAEGDGDPCGEPTAARYVAHLEPADYEGVNLGPDAPCDVALCFEHACALLPWEVPCF